MPNHGLLYVWSNAVVNIYVFITCYSSNRKTRVENFHCDAAELGASYCKGTLIDQFSLDIEINVSVLSMLFCIRHAWLRTSVTSQSFFYQSGHMSTIMNLYFVSYICMLLFVTTSCNELSQFQCYTYVTSGWTIVYLSENSVRYLMLSGCQRWVKFAILDTKAIQILKVVHTKVT